MSDGMELPPPLRGLNLTEAFGEQPPLTTREALNVRPYDPKSKRKRMAQRAGTIAYAGGDQVNGSARVEAILAVLRNQKHVDYSIIPGQVGDGTAGTVDAIEYQIPTPTERTSLNGTIDRQGNLYVLDGPSGVTKYNADGQEVWKLSVPVKNEDHIIRAIVVDRFDRLFVAVSEGGNEDEAGVWYFRQTVDEEAPEEVWFFQTDRYVQAMVVHEGRLYLAEDDPDEGQSYIRVLSGISTPLPLVDYEQDKVPFPVNDLAVAKDGSIYTASQPNAERGQNPQNPQFGPKIEAWSIENLPNFEERVWAHFRADDPDSLIVTSGVAPEDGDEILRWDDSRGSVRFFQKATDNSIPSGPEVGNPHEGPRYVADGLNGKPVLRFDGEKTGMQSGIATSLDRELSDQNAQALPAYTGAQYALFMLMRIPVDGTGLEPILVHPNSHPNTGGGDTTNRALIKNRIATETIPGGVNVGNLAWYDDSDDESGGDTIANPAHGASLHGHTDPSNGTYPLAHYDFREVPTRVVLVTVVLNGHDQTSSVNDRQDTIRVNGRPLDIWDGHRIEGLGPVYLGSGVTASSWTQLAQFDIAEMLVLRDPGSGNRVVSHPNSPRLEVPGSSFSDVEQIEAWIAYRWGVQSILDDREQLVFGSGNALTYLHNGGGGNATLDSGGANAFADYEWEPGDRFWCTVTSDVADVVAPYCYEITGKDDDDTIRLNANPGLIGGPATVEGHMVWTHAFNPGFGPPPSTNVASEPHNNLGLLFGTGGILAKWNPEKAKFNWAVASFSYGPPLVTPAVSEDYGGIGYGVRVSSDGEVVYSMGPANAADSNFALRGIIDEGDDFSVAGVDGAWATAIGGGSGDWDYAYPRMSVDEPDEDTGYPGDVLYVPWADSTGTYGGGFGPPVMGLFTKAGVNFLFIYLPGAADPQAQAALFDPAIPDYESDFTPTAFRAQHVYVLLDPVGNEKYAVYKYRTVDVDANNDGPRELTRLVVAGGDIAKFTSGAVAAVTGGSAALDAASGVVFGIAWREKGYLLDGTSRIKVYDPRTDEVTTMASKTSGRLPRGARIMELWRDRMVLAHFAEAPADWAMSEQGNPEGWNLFPPVVNFRQAVRGIVAEAGEAPGIVNGFVPLTDDVALFLLDRQVWRLSGDPAAGGQFDLLLDEVGGAFGRAWCKDPSGICYFLSTEGTVYRYVGREMPVPITRFNIDPLLMQLRLDILRAELFWNDLDKTVHLFLVPYDPDAADAQRSEFVYDVRTDSWWQDERAAGTQVTAAAFLRADDWRDRLVVLGHADGRLRVWDQDARDDDGDAITTSLLYGPYRAGLPHMELVWDKLRALVAETQQTLSVELYASDNPETRGEPVGVYSLDAGLSIRALHAGRGTYHWLRVFAGSPDHRWAIESLVVEGTGMGANKGRR